MPGILTGFLLSDANVPEDLVYQATKAIYENKPMLAAATQYMKSFEPSLMTEASVAPYYPGAETFFKDVGQRPPKEC